MRGLFLAAFVAVIAAFAPTPYYLEAPGQANDVSEILTIQGTRTYPPSGRFVLPTVVSEPATLLYCFYGLLDPEAVLRKEPRPPQAQSPGGGGAGQMALSQQLSTLVALRALGYNLKPELEGLEILELEADSPNHSRLQPGDLVLEAEGKRLTSRRQLRASLIELSSQQTILLKILRGKTSLNVQASTYSPRGETALGIVVRPTFKPFKFPVEVDFHSGNTSGASGGLVFALAIYDLLTPEDLTKGRTVAATGTLDADGTVGPIEGLEMKLKGAQRAGVTVTLVPKANYDALSWMPDNMEVIPVESFKQALDVLRR